MIKIVIDPECYYTETNLRIFGLDSDVLKRARQNENLRFKQISRGEYIYKGSWLREWIDRADQPVAAGGVK